MARFLSLPRRLVVLILVLIGLAVPAVIVAQDVLTMDNEEQKDWLTSFVQDRLSTPERQIRLSNIDGALGSAESLLTGLLDISRLDAGGMDPRPQVFRLDDVLQGLAAEFGVLAAGKGLVLHRAPCAAWVRTDPQLLRRVLQNFLGNALRYTARGRVRARVAP